MSMDPNMIAMMLMQGQNGQPQGQQQQPQGGGLIPAQSGSSAAMSAVQNAIQQQMRLKMMQKMLQEKQPTPAQINPPQQFNPQGIGQPIANNNPEMLT